MTKPDAGTDGRVSPTAPGSKAVSKGMWSLLEAQPGFNERLRAAEAELESGGGVVYEVRDGTLHKVRGSRRR